MNTPTFTAAASLYRTCGAFRSSIGMVNSVRHPSVVPQQFTNCSTACYCVPPVWFCYDECYRWDGSLYKSGVYYGGWCFLSWFFGGLPLPQRNHYHATVLG